MWLGPSALLAKERRVYLQGARKSSWQVSRLPLLVAPGGHLLAGPNVPSGSPSLDEPPVKVGVVRRNIRITPDIPF
jgi:hypothetical protein